ncbi:MAG: hypothetical protein R3E88_01785 [Myxococcota bacterium]|nr:hypothetical protein [Myxococcales bacterium]
MPCDYDIDSERGIVLSRGWGSVSDADLLTHQRRLAVDPRFSPAMNQLYDLRDVTEVEKVTSAGIRELAQHSPFGAGSRRVVLVASRVTFGLARMFQALADEKPDELRVVFDEMVEAERWIGIER